MIARIKKFQVDLHNISQEKFEELVRQIKVDKVLPSDQLTIFNSIYTSKRLITAAGEELNELNKKFNEQLEVLNEKLDENFNELNKNYTRKKAENIAEIMGVILTLAGVMIASFCLIIPAVAIVAGVSSIGVDLIIRRRAFGNSDGTLWNLPI